MQDQNGDVKPVNTQSKSTEGGADPRPRFLKRRTKIRWTSAIVMVIFGVIGIQLLKPSDAATTRPQAGVQFHCMWSSYNNTSRVQALDKLKAAGVEWVRIDYGWAGVETNGPVAKLDPTTQWYTKQMDFCVSEANKRGLKVLVTLWQTPKWASGATDSTANAELVRPASPSTYAAYAKKAAGYYNGTTANLKVHAWEVWNEPDPHQKFWINLNGTHGGNDKYAELVKAAYPQFKAGDPNAKVVLGGPTYQEFNWLKDMYSYGIKNSFDVVATHPYQGKADLPPEQATDGSIHYFTSFPKVLEVMKANGDGAKEVWFTEFGYSTAANTSTTQSWQLGVTESQQGDYLVRAFKYAQANWPNVTNMFVYNERAKSTSSAHQNGYGIMRADLSDKPAYTALKNYLTSHALDITSPTASITAPAANASLSGTANVTANANDNVGVTGVKLLVNGAVVATDTSAPYSFPLNTTSYANGNYTLTVQATDAAGNTALSGSVSVAIKNVVADTTKPATSITAPAVNATVSGTANVAANASDNIGVVNVKLLVNGAVVATDTSAPYSFPLNTTSYADGKYTLSTQATDAAGNTALSGTVAVIMKNAVTVTDTVKPTVSIASPQAGSRVSGTITVKVTAKDNIGLLRTSLYVDGVYYTSDSTAPYEYKVPTAGYSNRSKHTMHVSATDTSGNRSVSPQITVTVNNFVWSNPWTWNWSW